MLDASTPTEEIGLKISSPSDGEIFRHLPPVSGIRQEIKLVASGATDAPLYWFVNDRFFQMADAVEPVYWPLEKGAHTIACADAEGQTARVQIVVE